MKKIIRNFFLSLAILPSFSFALCPNFVPGQLSASALNNAIASPCITSGTIANVSITNAAITSSTVSGLAGSFTTLSASSNASVAGTLSASAVNVTNALAASSASISGTLSASAVSVTNALSTNTLSASSNVTVGGTLASSGAVSAPSLALSSAASAPSQAVRLDQLAYPYRNRLINGDMQISQINGASAVTPTVTDTYPIDQWKTDTTQASKLTFQQVVDAPPGFKYSEKITVAAQYAPLATDRFAIYQPVEGQNLIDFGLGTTSPSTLAMSLWLKCSTAGTYAVGLNNAGTRSYVGTVSCTTTWAKQIVTLVGDNTGTWATDNTIGAQFYIDLGSGSNFNTTAGAWQAGDFTRTTGTTTFVNLAAAQTFQVTGAQLEQIPAGAAVGTPFEFLTYDTQLRRAQRYLPCFNSSSTASFIAPAWASTSTLAVGIVNFDVPTRAPITGISASAASTFNFYSASPFTASAIAISSFISISGASVGLTIAGATAGQGGVVYFNNAAGQLCFTGAQL